MPEPVRETRGAQGERAPASLLRSGAGGPFPKRATLLQESGLEARSFAAGVTERRAAKPARQDECKYTNM